MSQPILLADPAADCHGLSADTVERWCRWFIVLGVIARCVRYISCFPLWEDECFLCANYISRDYLGLLQRLDFAPQVAPSLYLWVQLTVVRLLGFNEMALRLVAFIAGLASLYLFARLARLTLTGLPRLLAVGLFAVAYPCIRYSAEAKPYGTDLFVSLVMISLALKWLRDLDRPWPMWALILATPLMLGFSFPAVFVGGGLSLALLQGVWAQRSLTLRRLEIPWRQWILFNLMLVASFGLIYEVHIRKQMADELTGMHSYWSANFPPLTQPLNLVVWLVKTHASDMLSYPFGGPNFGSAISFIFWVVGLVWLVRRRQWTFLSFCLAPMLVTLLAASLQAYPYGGHVKLNLYLAPWICMVIALGWTWTVQGIAHFVHARRCVALAVLTLAVVVSATIVRDMVWPFKSMGDRNARAFAQWFWYDLSQNSEVCCMKADLNLDFAPATYNQLNFSAEYLCNQRIYSPPRAPKSIALGKISAKHPLSCVLYRDFGTPFDEGALQAWLDSVSAELDLSARTRLPMVRRDYREKQVINEAFVEVFSFVPRKDALAQGALPRLTPEAR